jgi:GNAT superfamily N-acetyltransferase
VTIILVEALTEARLPSLLALFEAASSPCFCRYWHFVGTKNDWLDRCAHHPEDNAAELTAAFRAGHPSAQGLVAISTQSEQGEQGQQSEQSEQSEQVVGWMKLTARAHVPKLRSLPVYKNLDLGDETTTFSIACMLVHPNARGNGVARALVEAAPRIARSWGARAIEAYPRRSTAPLYAEEAGQGPERVFIAADFAVLHDVSPYPIYRRTIPIEGG